MKTCSKCKIIKPLTDFYKDKRKSCGCTSACKECKKKEQINYNKKNRQIQSSKAKEYRLKNIERCRENDKKYHEENKEKRLLYANKYRNDNKLALSEKKKIYHIENREEKNEKSRIYHIENKEELRLKAKTYRDNNKELLKERRLIYYEENKELIAIRHRKWAQTTNGKIVILRLKNKRNAEKRSQSDGTLPDTIVIPLVEELQELLNNQNSKCNYCGDVISHAIGNIHLDHIYPVSRGGSDSIKNVQWLCAHCNTSKGAKIPTLELQKQWSADNVL